jgi:predicted  nucleic acid-binding Zn-ribbon protein
MQSVVASITCEGEVYRVEASILPPDNILHISATGTKEKYETRDKILDNGRIAMFPLLKKSFETNNGGFTNTLTMEKNNLLLVVHVSALDMDLKFLLESNTSNGAIVPTEFIVRVDKVETQVSSLVKDLPSMLQQAVSNLPITPRSEQKFDYVFLTNRIQQMVREELKTVVADLTNKNRNDFDSTQNKINECMSSVARIGETVKNIKIEPVAIPQQQQQDPRLDNIEKLETTMTQLLQQQESQRVQFEKEFGSLSERYNQIIQAQNTITETVASLSEQIKQSNTIIETTIKQEQSENLHKAIESISTSSAQLNQVVTNTNQETVTYIGTLRENIEKQTQETATQIKQLEKKIVESIDPIKTLISEKSASQGAVETMVDQYHEFCSEKMETLLASKFEEQFIPDKCIGTIEFKTSKIHSLILLPGEQELIATSHDHSNINIWYLKQGTLFNSFPAGERDVVGLTVVDDDTILFGYYSARNLRVYNWRTGKCLNVINTQADMRTATHKQILCFGDERQYAAVAHRSTPVISIYDIRKKGGRIVRTLNGHTLDVNCIQFLPNGRLLSASNDTTIRIWDVDSGECYLSLTGHNDWVRSLEIIDEKTIISGGDDGTVRAWDIDTGKQTRVITRDIGWVYDIVALSPHYIMTASKDGKVRILNVERSECVRSLSGHRKDVTSILVLGDGRMVSASDDGTVRTWSPGY